MPPETVQLTEERIQCVVQAVQVMFEWISSSAPQLKNQGPASEIVESPVIVGIISLVGDVEWALVIGLPPETAPNVAEGFAGMPIPYESEEMGDAVGELANLVAGEAKANLDALGIAVDLSLPQVLRGDPVELLSLQQTEARGLAFDSSAGVFWVTVVAGAR